MRTPRRESSVFTKSSQSRSPTKTKLDAIVTINGRSAGPDGSAIRAIAASIRTGPEAGKREQSDTHGGLRVAAIFVRMSATPETYYRKGLGLKAEVQDDIAADYQVERSLVEGAIRYERLSAA